MSTEGSSELERQRRVFELLAEVCELEPAARERALAACDDPEVARAVREKLTDRSTVGTWLETPLPLEAAPPEIQIGDRLGPFEIRALLGEGGMGRVFRAVQRQPVAREIALKILRLGRLHPEAAVRFEAERQAMGRLDHPHIGRILEAGSTDDGLPYFAMELIDGPPITTYCDQAALSIEERLRLFLDVCRATHHAHLKLLLHRDLKPSNVLVAEVDGRHVLEGDGVRVVPGDDEEPATDRNTTRGRRRVAVECDVLECQVAPLGEEASAVRSRHGA